MVKIVQIFKKLSHFQNHLSWDMLHIEMNSTWYEYMHTIYVSYNTYVCIHTSVCVYKCIHTVIAGMDSISNFSIIGKQYLFIKDILFQNNARPGALDILLGILARVTWAWR